MRLRIFCTATIAPLLLAGCVSLGGGKPPDQLLNLTLAEDGVAAGTVRSGPIGSALIVQMPSVPQKLRNVRIPVESGGTAIAYVPEAQWVEPPARLFQRLLTESIAASSNRLVLNESENITGPGEVLTGELSNFGIDGDTREAVVSFVAVRLQGDGQQLVQRRFEARVPIAQIDAMGAAAALSRAANQVAAEVSVWMAEGS